MDLESQVLEWKKPTKIRGDPVDQTFLFTLLFADDQVLVAQNDFDLEHLY
jgi:hypothetical protein